MSLVVNEVEVNTFFVRKERPNGDVDICSPPVVRTPTRSEGDPTPRPAHGHGCSDGETSVRSYSKPQPISQKTETRVKNFSKTDKIRETSD